MANINVVLNNNASTFVCTPTCDAVIGNVILNNGIVGTPFVLYFDCPVNITGIRGRRLGELVGLTLGDINAWDMETFYTVEVT